MKPVKRLTKETKTVVYVGRSQSFVLRSYTIGMSFLNKMQRFLLVGRAEGNASIVFSALHEKWHKREQNHIHVAKNFVWLSNHSPQALLDVPRPHKVKEKHARSESRNRENTLKTNHAQATITFYLVSKKLQNSK